MERSPPMTRTLRTGLTAQALGASAPAWAQSPPAPYLSRELDAALPPLTTWGAFDLHADDAGLLVLDPAVGGVADENGIRPGDALEFMGGGRIVMSAELDVVVRLDRLRRDRPPSTCGAAARRRGSTPLSPRSAPGRDRHVQGRDSRSWSSESVPHEEPYSEQSEMLVENGKPFETLVEETVWSEEFASETFEDPAEEVAKEDHTSGAASGLRPSK